MTLKNTDTSNEVFKALFHYICLKAMMRDYIHLLKQYFLANVVLCLNRHGSVT
uniref:Uncharacterized protein n=1 Tax=Amphimedon queenslandica TaxID=400682 RepID=A0A1X7UXX6_AMPQE